MLWMQNGVRVHCTFHFLGDIPFRKDSPTLGHLRLDRTPCVDLKSSRRKDCHALWHLRLGVAHEATRMTKSGNYSYGETIWHAI